MSRHSHGIRARWSGTFLALATALLLTAPARLASAGGAWVYENGSPDLGTASAGRAALAADASTAFNNPAGMIHLGRPQFLVSLMPIVTTNEFNIGPRTTTPGTDGGNAGGLVPGGALYGVYQLRPEVAFGLSFNSYVGGALSYDDNWVGRYFTTTADFLTYTLNPALAVRVLPWLSVGAGFSVQYARMDQEVAINNIREQLPDGRLKYDDWNVGFGGNFGALAEIDEWTRVGLTYRSPVNQSFDSVPVFSQLGPGLQRFVTAAGFTRNDLGMDVAVPQEVLLSVFRQVTDDLALMGNLGWQNWTQFGWVSLEFPTREPRSLTVNQHLQDTIHAALGLHYRLGAPTLLQLGFAYDSTAVGGTYRLPALPVDQQLRFAGGVQYDVNEKYTLGLAYEFLAAGKAAIDAYRGPLSGTLQGDYSPNSGQFFNFTIIRRF